ncbi:MULTISPECIES: metallophosphoesterase family protein [unclassified Streptomyces]|uniref:metallophosphoesterase family protein n=1 Tax=unclassified Streptomyces TaxID=2593676 RepID=UPI001904DAEB|nr:metallophosphoesterase [Streptomyces sp. HSG2]
MARVPAQARHPLGPPPRSPRLPARRRPDRGAAPTGLATRRRPVLDALGLFAVMGVGAWLGLLTVGNVEVPVGPMDTTMALRPSVTGGTEINVSPLGALRFDSHTGPFRLDVNVDRLDPERSQVLVDHPERLSGLQSDVAEDVGGGTRDLALRSGVAVVTGATALGLAVYRRPRPALAAGGLALTLLAASGGTAYATWDPDSVLEPRFSGLLTSAPSLVGDARSIVTEFDVYQQELARLVTNVTKLYDAASTLPVYQPDPTTIRVLHVSDLHLNPAGWKITSSLVDQYEIDVIVDSGDTMDHGSAAENGYLDPIEDLGAPYVWVRGNHDSLVTQRYIEELRNTHVLDDGRAVTLAGLRFAGTGDPQFTPDRTREEGAEASQKLAGARLASALRDQRAAGTPVDVAVVHEPEAAREVDGTVPLVLAGHLHRNKTEVMEYGTRLRVGGSTGGSGLRAVQGEHPDPIQASVLYFDRETRRLQAWDEIELGGLGLSTAEVSRHLPEENQPGAAPSPSVAGSPTSATAPAPTEAATSEPVPTSAEATAAAASGTSERDAAASGTSPPGPPPTPPDALPSATTP